MKRQILAVIGTRPEAVKLAPLVLALRGHDRLRPVVVTTGQHTEIVNEVLDTFGIVADVSLSVAEVCPNLDGVAASVISEIGELVRGNRPAAVVVQGDTTSAFGAALAAFYQRVPVAHLEAGLRSGDPLTPYPEEVHRRLTSTLADLHFAPTRGAAAQLLTEGVDPATVHLTGNTVVDALRMIRGHRFPYRDSRLTALETDKRLLHRRVILVTAHRRESWGEPMSCIARAVEQIALARPHLVAVVGMHPNPVVRKAFAPLAALGNVLLVESEPYGSFVRLMELADVILTDSGGIQEEAPILGTPVLVLRDLTERREGILAGVTRLVGTESDCIVAETDQLLDDPRALAVMAQPRDLYGDGHAAARCAAALAADPSIMDD